MFFSQGISLSSGKLSNKLGENDALPVQNNRSNKRPGKSLIYDYSVFLGARRGPLWTFQRGLGKRRFSVSSGEVFPRLQRNVQRQVENCDGIARSEAKYRPTVLTSDRTLLQIRVRIIPADTWRFFIHMAYLQWLLGIPNSLGGAGKCWRRCDI